MQTLIETVQSPHSPESLVEQLQGRPGRILLRSACFEFPQARFSFVVAEPFLVFRSFGARCEIHRRHARRAEVHFGNPWRVLDQLLARFELLDAVDAPFPLGGAFGFFGFDLGSFVEPRLRRRTPPESALPDGWIGFYDSLIAFDHTSGKTSIVATGLQGDGSRQPAAARESLRRWRHRLLTPPPAIPAGAAPNSANASPPSPTPRLEANFTREAFLAAVIRAQQYIRAGDIYQVNLAQQFRATPVSHAWAHWRALFDVSPAPFGAFLDAGDFQIASTSPELFLRLSGSHIVTRPIKGTRPRAADPTLDAQLAFELQTSPKETAELVMITDLLRHDLGRVCEFGSVRVPDLLRLERFGQVQHLVSTVEGHLRPDTTHLAALESCFPGGSVTGAPKIRATEIIHELEPDPRGPYTGCAGYLGFNRESQFNILIRTSVVHDDVASYHAGAGIVADSDPEAEYRETLDKARAFLSVTSALVSLQASLPHP